MPNPTSAQSLFESIDSFLGELQATKSAAAPKRAARKKATDGVGKTTHPSADVDDSTQDAPEGARYSENTRDVEDDVQGDAITGDDPIDANQDDVMPNIGLNQSATGEDSSIETESVKGTKDDPGTDHPADAEDIGGKYASMSFDALYKVAEAKANNLLACIVNLNTIPAQQQPQQRQSKQAQARPAQQPQQQGNTQQLVSGYMAATDAAPGMNLQKQAEVFVEQIMREAEHDADEVATMWHAYWSKRAAEAPGGDVPPDAIPPDAGGMPPGAGGMPPDMGGGGGPPPDMGGGGGDAGGAPPGAGGGGDALAALGAAAQDAPPMGGGDGGGGGGGDKAQALQDLLMVLHELGFSEEDLASLSQNGPKPEEGAKIASAALQFRRSGKFRFTEAKTARDQARRNTIRNYVMEITGIK